MSGNEIHASSPRGLLAALGADPHHDAIKLPAISHELASDLGRRFGRGDIATDDLLLELRTAPQKLFEAMVLGSAPDGAEAETLIGADGVRVVALPTTSMNAYATFAANGLPLIILNQGLITFIYNFLRVLSTRFRFGGPEPELPPLQATAEKIAELLEWSSFQIPRVATFSVTDEQMKMASRLATEAERFVVAHEFAHIFLGHHAGAGQAAGRVNDIGVEVASYQWEREYEADQAGLNVILELISRQQVEPPLAYAGVELFFVTAELLLDSVAGVGDDESHPPPAERLKAIREYMHEVLPDEPRRQALARVAGPIEELIDDLRATAISEAERRRRAAERELESLLEQCAQGEHPDDARFQVEITRMLDEHPATTLAVMRAELHSAFAPRSVAIGPGARRNRRTLAVAFAFALPPELRKQVGFNELLKGAVDG